MSLIANYEIDELAVLIHTPVNSLPAPPSAPFKSDPSLDWMDLGWLPTSRVANHKKFEHRPKLGPIAQLGDLSKWAACSKMATAKLGWVGEIVLMRSHNLCGPQNSF